MQTSPMPYPPENDYPGAACKKSPTSGAMSLDVMNMAPEAIQAGRHPRDQFIISVATALGALTVTILIVTCMAKAFFGL